MVILTLVGGGCSKDPGPEVWVIGLDGADWDQLDPMIARGEMPHLASLRDGGAAGILRSDMPMISPILWTSIGTGKTPDQHGVTWFMTDGPDGSKMPISSQERRGPDLLEHRLGGRPYLRHRRAGGRPGPPSPSTAGWRATMWPGTASA